MTGASKLRILVIDDEPRLRQVCHRVLEPRGYEVFDAADGREGLKAIDEVGPHLVLVDLMMPNLNGFEVLEAARENHPDLSFVVITGFATLEKAVEAMKQGADDFLAKPFRPDDLALVVERVLRRVKTLQDMVLEKSRTRLIVEYSANGVLVINADGRIALMNPVMREIAGLGDEDHRGEPVEDVLPCKDVVEALKCILEAGDESQSRRTCNTTVATNREPLHLEVTCKPFLDTTGHTLGALAIFNDVTAWQRLDELKNEYVSTVAHDIASPLGSVISQLQTLESGLAGELNEKQAHLIQRARMRVQGIVDLSKDLLDLSKMESGSMGEPEQVDLEGLLKEAVDVHRNQAKAKGQALELDIAPDLPLVMGIPRAVGQVFNNLVSNAVRYTPDGGQVRVSAVAGPGMAVVSVADTGFGIPEEDRGKIFNRFYRVKDSNTRHIVGTGLGLPIVKQVVEEMGGRIELESEPGKGSTFTVKLPAGLPE